MSLPGPGGEGVAIGVVALGLSVLVAALSTALLRGARAHLHELCRDVRLSTFWSRLLVVGLLLAMPVAALGVWVIATYGAAAPAVGVLLAATMLRAALWLALSLLGLVLVAALEFERLRRNRP